MKASTAYDGVEEIYPLIGPVPAHWRVLDLKLIANVFPSNVDKKTEEDETPVLLCNYTDVYYNDVIKPNMPFMRASATSEQIKRFTLRKWDVLFTKDSETADDIGIPALVLQDLPGVVCGYHLSVLRTNHLSIGPFLKYYFESNPAKAYFECSANGLTRVGLGQYAVDNLPVCAPPVYEQRQIAAYLNRETAKIDRLIAKQKRLIALLQEKRQAVISQAVTKGLDPNAKMKDSGVEWLGAVPETFEVVSLTRYVLDIVDYRGRTPTKSDEGVYLITAKNIRKGYIDYACSEEYILESEYEDVMRRGKPNVGDVLFTMEAPLGNVAMVDRLDVAIAQRVIKFRVNNDFLLGEYLMFSILSTWFQSQLESLATGSTALGLKASKLNQLRIAVPDLIAQKETVDILKKTLATLDHVKAQAFRQIDLLREHRQALISAAVTGKIDVRGLVTAEEVAALEAVPVEMPELETEEDASYTTEEEQG